MLVVRMGLQSQDRAVMSLGLILAMAALTLFGAGHYRHRQLSRSAMAPPLLLAFAAASVAFAAFAAVLALVT